LSVTAGPKHRSLDAIAGLHVVEPIDRATQSGIETSEPFLLLVWHRDPGGSKKCLNCVPIVFHDVTS
jgi:hypothetical protein